MKNQIPLKHNLDIMNDTVPSLRYDGSVSLEEWQKEAKDKLNELLGLPFEKCDPCFEIEYERELEDAKEIRFTFQSEEGYFVPCHFFIPKNIEKPKPIVICLQGHSKGMHVSMRRTRYEGEEVPKDGDRDFAVQAVKEGHCALVMEQRNFGECGGTADGHRCYYSTLTALLLGRTTIGERVWDVQRAIDVLEEQFAKYYNGYCICLGNSGGGTTTYYAACLDERIKLAVSSCAVCSFDDSIAVTHHCTCNFVPNIRKYFDMGDMGGMIAPRKLIVVAGKDDQSFPLPGVKKSYNAIEEMFKVAGCGDNCALVIGDGGHRFYANDAWSVIKRMLG